MNAVTKRSPVAPLTELFDWFESGWPAVAEWRREAAHALRIEDHLEDDRYVVRAEIPGIDPDKDVKITVADGVLTISAERREEVSEKGRSAEFHYGSFLRRVSLPPGAAEEKLVARYEDGILEVTVPISAAQAQPRTIPVARGPASSRVARRGWSRTCVTTPRLRQRVLWGRGIPVNGWSWLERAGCLGHTVRETSRRCAAVAGYVQAIGLDLDGTLTEGSVLSAEAMTATAAARERGIAVVLVTGRILCELRGEFPDLEQSFDAVLAENGAVLSS